MKRVLWLAPMLLVWSGAALALGQNELVKLAGQYNLLSADIGMTDYDPENIEYLEQALDTYQTVSEGVPAWIDMLPSEQRAVAAQEWDSMREIMEGDGNNSGLLNGSYDLNASAAQRIHYDTLQTQLFQVEPLRAENLSDLQTLYLKLASVVSGYVALTSNPFGSMAMSMNDGDLKLVTLAADIDQLFVKLIKQSEDDMQAQQLRRQQSKWQFVRSTVVKGSQSAMPYIVRYQGKQMIAELSSLLPTDQEQEAVAP